MTENTELATEVESEVSTKEAAPTKSQVKKYSDEDVNGIVAKAKGRLETGFTAERAAWETERTTYTSELESLQAVVKDAVINVVTAKMSATEKRLFEALPFEKQLEQVKDPEFLASLNQKVTTPETPETAKSTKTLFRRTSSL